MVVGVCGLGWTGSGAVYDLLKEYGEVEPLYEGGEFGFVYKLDGILDLKYHLVDGACRDMSSKHAISRFLRSVENNCTYPSRIQKLTNNQYRMLSYKYVSSISQIKWQHFVFSDYTYGGRLRYFEGRVRHKLQRILRKNFKKRLSVFPLKTCYFSVLPEKFDEVSKEYIMGIVHAMSKGTDKIQLLDQPFAGDHPERSFQFYDDPYAIVVDRDPRDLYLMMKYVCKFEGHMLDDVHNFITYYRRVRMNTNNSEHNRILRLQFEDLIYDYSMILKKITSFLQLTDHKHPKKYFVPEKSINNTQLWHLYENEADNISIIQKELAQWLYLFPKSDRVIHTRKSF